MNIYIDRLIWLILWFIFLFFFLYNIVFFVVCDLYSVCIVVCFVKFIGSINFCGFFVVKINIGFL